MRGNGEGVCPISIHQPDLVAQAGMPSLSVVRCASGLPRMNALDGSRQASASRSTSEAHVPETGVARRKTARHVGVKAAVERSRERSNRFPSKCWAVSEGLRSSKALCQDEEINQSRLRKLDDLARIDLGRA